MITHTHTHHWQYWQCDHTHTPLTVLTVWSHTHTIDSTDSVITHTHTTDSTDSVITHTHHWHYWQCDHTHTPLTVLTVWSHTHTTDSTDSVITHTHHWHYSQTTLQCNVLSVITHTHTCTRHISVQACTFFFSVLSTLKQQVFFVFNSRPFSLWLSLLAIFNVMFGKDYPFFTLSSNENYLNLVEYSGFWKMWKLPQTPRPREIYLCFLSWQIR